MEYEQGMTRASLKNIFGSVIRRMWLILLLAAAGFLIANIAAWRSYSSRYQVSFSFVPSGYQAAGEEVRSTESFSNHIARSISCAAMVKNSQMSSAVIRAVDFDLTTEEYNRAVAVSSAENSAVVNIMLVWTDEAELRSMQRVMKAYLTYLIGTRSGLGEIRWIDGYAEPVLQEQPSRYVKAAIGGIAGGVTGLMLGILAAALLGLLDERVFELEQIRYRREMCPLHVIPGDFLPRRLRGGLSADYHKNCEALAGKLAEMYRRDHIRTVAWVPVGKNQEMATVGLLTAQYVEAYGIRVEVLTLSEGALDKGPGRITQWLQNVVKEAQDKRIMIFIKCPDLTVYRSQHYILSQLDLTLFLFRYGKNSYGDLLYAQEQYRELKKTGCVWTDADRKYLKRPLREFQAVSG